MKSLTKVAVCMPFLLCALATVAHENPIGSPLSGAIVDHRGTYFALSAEENGTMLVSGNLVDWRASARVFPANVAGPYELIRRNGLFHLHTEQGGYAVSQDPLAPFSMFIRTGQSGGQMRMYQDAGGALFSVNRRSGSEEGEIWLQRYSAPWKTRDKPDLLLDGRYGMWDSLDSANLGEPEIFAYRGNYYLLYAANNPSPRTGLREIGLAVNENPLRLANEDKVADPVLVRNVDRLSRVYHAIAPSAEFGPWRGRYTFEQPEEGWMLPGFRLSGWRTGDAGFGAPDEIDGAQLHACRTEWEGDLIWIRREFELDRGVPEKPVLNIRHEGAVQVFINGRKVYETLAPSIAYSNIDISEAAKGAFREGENVLAVQSRALKDAAYRFIDFGIMDAGEQPVEPTVYGLNAPRLVTGPNGFEKWLYYQAWWNGKPGTGIDRVFFFDKEMVVDGPTTATSPGYHPPPAMPTFTDDFPKDENLAWADRWHFSGGQWMSYDGVMRQSASEGAAKGYLKRSPAANYLFETEIRFPASGRGDVGVVAWSDGQTDFIISINPRDGTWQYHIEPGGLAPRKFKLPPAFSFLQKPPGMKEVENAMHRLRITKNAGLFEVSLNGMDLHPGEPITTRMVGPGLPGFYCNDSVAEFDGVTYTVGWDEYDQYITGWGSAADGTAAGGDWSLDQDLGLYQRSHSAIGRAFKGDLLEQYEFTVNAQLYAFEEGKDRLYGVFPVYTDRDNYIKAMIDTKERQLVVTGRLAGREIGPVAKSLGTTVAHRHLYDKTTPYRDITSWVYELRSESVVSGLEVRWLEGEYEHLRQEFFVPSDEMVVKYAKLERGRSPNLWEDGRFYEADEPKPLQQRGGIFNPIDIRPEIANYVGFGFYTSGAIVIDSRTGRYIRDYTPGETLDDNEEVVDDTAESETMSRPQHTVVHLDVESSYFFRCVKLKDRVVIELNGRPMIEVQGSWPPSQVGLLTEGQPTYFNGMTLMHLPEEPIDKQGIE